MLEILSARNTQSTVSEINYRKYLHQWICLPDMQTYVQARKVNEQLSDVSGRRQLGIRMTVVSNCECQVLIFLFGSPQIFYKDDLNWLKGIGCYAWDTPEILRVKRAGDLQSEVSSTCFPSASPIHFSCTWVLLSFASFDCLDSCLCAVFFVSEPVQG